MAEGERTDNWSSRRLRAAGADGGLVVGSFGGHPRGVRTSAWPRCAVCRAPMCHLAQIDAGPWLDLGPYHRLTAFICHATGGRCEDWDPRKGGNKVLLHADLDDAMHDGPPTVRVYRRVRLAAEPSVDERELFRIGKERGLTMPQLWESLRYDKLGGAPSWVHGDDTPQNLAGLGPMRLAVQLSTDLVAFDITKGGVAWIFFDPNEPTADAARMLWQGG